MARFSNIVFSSIVLLFLAHNHNMTNGQGEMQVVFKFVSFSNPNGTIKNGTCCDESGKTAGLCSPDMCDVLFSYCASSKSFQGSCDVLKKQSVPVIYNNNSFYVGNKIGNSVNEYFNTFVVNTPYTPTGLNITFDVDEISAMNYFEDIADFHYFVDWVDPKFNETPHYKRITINDSYYQLVVDIVSQCREHYYTKDCSVHCRPDNNTLCLDSGTRHCKPGWQGADCKNMIDYCPGNQCQHGSTCIPVLLNYTCVCTPGYTGRHCETISIPKIVSPATKTVKTSLAVLPTSSLISTPTPKQISSTFRQTLSTLTTRTSTPIATRWTPKITSPVPTITSLTLKKTSSKSKQTWTPVTPMSLSSLTKLSSTQSTKSSSLLMRTPVPRTTLSANLLTTSSTTMKTFLPATAILSSKPQSTTSTSFTPPITSTVRIKPSTTRGAMHISTKSAPVVSGTIPVNTTISQSANLSLSTPLPPAKTSSTALSDTITIGLTAGLPGGLSLLLIMTIIAVIIHVMKRKEREREVASNQSAVKRQQPLQHTNSARVQRNTIQPLAQIAPFDHTLGSNS